jgi:hypothetical protein
MKRHEFLEQLHELARPRNYLEIGVNDGRSLALSRVPSIAIDPAFKITVALDCDLQLVKATSDDFFARRNPIGHLRSSRNPVRNLRRGRAPFARWVGGTILDLAFIDGLHLFEFALRDFMNVERYAGWTSLIVLDDILPRNIDEGARERHTAMWAGDVYKIVAALRDHRPDLVVLPMDTQPTGVLVVLGADPTNRALKRAYDGLVAAANTPDPQAVPAEVLERRGTVDPERFLASPIIPLLRKHRRSRKRGDAYERLREEAAALLG